MTPKEFFQDRTNWAKLTGSPKQIAWAEDIRRRWADNCEYLIGNAIMKQYKAGTLNDPKVLGQVEAGVAAVREKLETVDSAADWIGSGYDFSQLWYKRVIKNAMSAWLKANKTADQDS